MPRPTLLDGGMATTLQRVGLPVATSPTPWVATHPDAVRDAHRAFVDAGAGVILTVTLCGTARGTTEARRSLPEPYGGVGGADALNAAAVRLARAAASSPTPPRRGSPPVQVAGSIGPVAQVGRPWTPADAEAGALWAAQARALGEADLLVLETFVDAAEALAALVAVRPVYAGPIVVSLVPDDAGRLYAGDGFGPWARRLVDAGADGVGANCGTGPAGIARAVEDVRAAVDVPTWAKPNAGLPRALEGEAWVAAAAAIPARWVGGCCGVGPETIRALGAALGTGRDEGAGGE